MFNRLFSSLALIAMVIALSACGKADVKKTSSQVAAKVNGEEISVHQVNSVIARSSNISPEQAKQAAGQVLQRIIDQELLVQKALKAKLDRDPQVMQAIEGARRQILARAYVERAISGASTEGQEEISKFYKENPALFERRRLYRVHELVVVAPQERLKALRAAAADTKGLGEVAGWLKSQKLPFDVAISSRPAEQIPLDILPRLFEMHDGQIAVIPTSGGASVVQLLQSEEAPLSEQQAVPIIERYLLNRKRLELAEAEVRKLREQAKIEYVGEFEAAQPAPATAQPAPSRAARGSSFADGGHVERGLAALR